jgi:hypothetical protein
MVVCLVVIPGGRGVVVYLSPCVNPWERELARGSQNMRISGEKGEKYHMVYGIVPYGIWYRTVRYMVSYHTVYGIVPYGIGLQGGKLHV